MNERIEKLLEQAGAEWDDKYHWYVGSVVMEKFAALIIQKCIEQCDLVEEDEELSDEAFTFRDGALMCRVEIKGYFGVK